MILTEKQKEDILSLANRMFNDNYSQIRPYGSFINQGDATTSIGTTNNDSVYFGQFNISILMGNNGDTFRVYGSGGDIILELRDDYITGYSGISYIPITLENIMFRNTIATNTNSTLQGVFTGWVITK